MMRRSQYGKSLSGFALGVMKKASVKRSPRPHLQDAQAYSNL
jgi:hypothetical protein